MYRRRLQARIREKSYPVQVVFRQSSTESPPAPLDRLVALPRRALSGLAALFPRNPTTHDVVTRAAVPASPQEVWRRIVFYEEVPHRPPMLLRLLLPVPLRTSKPSLVAGALVQCSYSGGGHLMKRITEVKSPSLVRFEVIEQRLGVEQYLTTVAGSYDIRDSGDGSEVALTTIYRGHLRPRWLWRGPERWLAHALHRHILGGMGATFGTHRASRAR